MYIDEGIYHRKYRQLDVYKQIHLNVDENNMVILEG